MKIILIRHLPTKGNLESRYIGSLDEPLVKLELDDTSLEAYKRTLDEFAPQRIISSPLTRAKETAALFFPCREIEVCNEFREMHFGLYEGKNYQDLKHEAAYQKFIDAGGTIGFPEGEEPEQFKKRCRDAFFQLTMENENETIALIVHGGTIMAIIEAVTGQSYYDFQVGCSEGFYLEYDKRNRMGMNWYPLKGLKYEKK